MESTQRKITPGLHKPSGGGGPSSENLNLRGNRIKAVAPRPNPQRTHMMRLRSCGDEETGAAAGHPVGPCPVGSQKTKSPPLLIDLTESPETANTPLALQNSGAHNGDVVSDTAVVGTWIDEIEDVDAIHKEDYYENYYFCSEYVCEIVRYSAELEKKYPINPNYLRDRQINSRMRAILMDWLVEVVWHLNLYPETLYLSHKIIDRFLSVNSSISREELQLVGVTALFMASKYEEAGTWKISQFINVCIVNPHNPITKETIRAMELKMLVQLQYDLASPPPILFFRRFSKIAKAQSFGIFGNHDIHATARYVMELSIVDYSVVDMMPSAVAAGSLALAMMIWKRESLGAVWTPTLEHHSAYAVQDLRLHTLRMAKVLARVQEGPNFLNLSAVQREYKRPGDPCYEISKKDELKVDWWKERVMNELENPRSAIPLSDPA